jgi:uncharacterized repeat protein (TIGR01451 family)
MSRRLKGNILWLLPRISFLLILILLNAAAGEQTIKDGNQTIDKTSNGLWTLFENDDKALSTTPSYTEGILPELSSIGPAKVTFNLQNNSSSKEVRNIITANDTAKSFRLLANDANNSLLKYEINLPPIHGNLSGTAPNLQYLPEKGYTGKDSFGFGVEDENGNRWNISASIDIVQLYHPPSVRIRSPQNGMIFAYNSDFLIEIPIHVTASGQGISEIKIYADLTEIGTISCSGSGSCSGTFIWTDPLYGKHTLIAEATDGMGVTCMSLPVVIVINPPEPLVRITSPANGQIFTSPARITIAAQVVDSNPIEKVEFFANSQKVGEATDAPYQYDWTDVAPGVYNLAAIATDDQDNSAISESILTIVVPPQPLAKADLAITLKSSPNPIRKRGNFNYYLTVTNRGPSSATNVFVNDFLPSELDYVSSGASQGEYDYATGTWDVGAITKYRSAKLVITVKVPIDAQSGQIINEAEVAGSESDPNNSNNYAINYAKIRAS